MLAPCSKKDLTFDTAATQLCTKVLSNSRELAHGTPHHPLSLPAPCLLLLCVPSLQVVAVAIAIAIVSNVVVVVAIRCNLFMCAHCSCVLLSSLSTPHPPTLWLRFVCALPGILFIVGYLHFSSLKSEVFTFI